MQNQNQSKKVSKKQGQNKRVRISADEANRRYASIRKWFRDNGFPSPAKANAALVKGDVTGKPEVSMNVKKLYALRKEEQGKAGNAAVPPSIPADEFKAQRRLAPQGATAVAAFPFSERAKECIRNLVEEMKSLPLDISDLILTRGGQVRVGRRQEEQVPVTALLAQPSTATA